MKNNCLLEAEEIMFRWHKSFSFGTSWKKVGKKRTPSSCKVVLTNMKVLRNHYHFEQTAAENSGSTDSVDGHSLPQMGISLDSHESNVFGHENQTKSNCHTSFSKPGTTDPSYKHQKYKFETEDSGVELPSGTNSPSTPTGSEKSFVVHRRDSSCDSGVMSASPSSSPAINHMLLIGDCPDIRASKIIQSPDQQELAESETVQGETNCIIHFASCCITENVMSCLRSTDTNDQADAHMGIAVNLRNTDKSPKTENHMSCLKRQDAFDQQGDIAMDSSINHSEHLTGFNSVDNQVIFHQRQADVNLLKVTPMDDSVNTTGTVTDIHCIEDPLTCAQSYNPVSEQINSMLDSSTSVLINAADCHDTEDHGSSFHNQEDVFKQEHKNYNDDADNITADEIPESDDNLSENMCARQYNDMSETVLLEQPLKKYPTSDSLDEYMDECCRLSEVNQGKAKALGSGLGYLEHICQLIEKIGQLQEHNLRLQKQICTLQKDLNLREMKEEYVLQQCLCGAASLLNSSYQEARKHFSWGSRLQDPAVQNENLASAEGAGLPPKVRRRGGRDPAELREDSLLPSLLSSLKKTASHHKLEENTSRRSWDKASMQAAGQSIHPLRRVENHPWVRMRDLVKKTKFKNQNKLGLSSSALKRSCPQLYRPDIISSDSRKNDRNSMIILRPTIKNENFWPRLYLSSQGGQS